MMNSARATDRPDVDPAEARINTAIVGCRLGYVRYRCRAHGLITRKAATVLRRSRFLQGREPRPDAYH